MWEGEGGCQTKGGEIEYTPPPPPGQREYCLTYQVDYEYKNGNMTKQKKYMFGINWYNTASF